MPEKIKKCHPFRDTFASSMLPKSDKKLPTCFFANTLFPIENFFFLFEPKSQQMWQTWPYTYFSKFLSERLNFTKEYSDFFEDLKFQKVPTYKQNFSNWLTIINVCKIKIGIWLPKDENSYFDNFFKIVQLRTLQKMQ